MNIYMYICKIIANGMSWSVSGSTGQVNNAFKSLIRLLRIWSLIVFCVLNGGLVYAGLKLELIVFV